MLRDKFRELNPLFLEQELQFGTVRHPKSTSADYFDIAVIDQFIDVDPNRLVFQTDSGNGKGVVTSVNFLVDGIRNPSCQNFIVHKFSLCLDSCCFKKQQKS